MKANTHPQFNTHTKVTCLCGNTFETGSTLNEIHVEICSNCHPVYTGIKRFVDTLGRVDKFMLAQQKASQASQAGKKKVSDQVSSNLPQQKSLKDMLEDARKS